MNSHAILRTDESLHAARQTALAILTVLLSLVWGCRPGAVPAAAEPISKTAFRQDDESKTSVFADLADRYALPPTDAPTKVQLRPSAFIDVAADLNLHFRYENGARGQQLMVEATGGGCAWLDYDQDGAWDLYSVQGGDPAAVLLSTQPVDALFRNRRQRGFIEVASSAGIQESDYGQGVSAADFDNDGFPDLYVANIGQDHLFHNLGDGTFEEIAAQSGISEQRWSTSSGWGDIDRDGDLDLYVCNYCDYDSRHPRQCVDLAGRPSICHPKDVTPVPDELYLSSGDGRFIPMAQSLGVFGEGNRGLGIVIADLDNDDWPDLFVANDTTPNFLFLNDQGARFRESAVLLGCAVNADGVPQANMGIGCGDFDRNGYLDLYVTTFSNEWNSLYANYGPQGFADVTALNGLVVPTLPILGFGTVMQDFNGDGWLELFVANGHINERRTEGLGYAMRPQLFAFDGRNWQDASATAGDYFQHRHVGRGSAECDFDGDGRLDLAVVHHDSPLALLKNESVLSHWLELSLVCLHDNRDGISTRVEVTTDDGTQMADLYGGGGYCSARAAVLHVAIGDNTADDCTIQIKWPDGRRHILSGVAVDQRWIVVEPSLEDAAAQPILMSAP